ncbi:MULTISPECIES: VolA/Pla-1 family phospholipase [unclassified Pseudoalteromonas]|uniref:VolA/Pla-1 family phospholipase n=1 Tax=unclassified Pseudoalteromonas TaxID=194690 RepID=UPI0016030AC7|nr:MULTISPECIES: VolA/Pla-1 family phospholipase [unclassified Pseudoalteromonas]MBB1332597.1 lipase [Pseudoalteromonas sp. SR41-6]MBB1457813.1 lipase [Pseudoalteromonas sp. SG41-8]
MKKMLLSLAITAALAGCGGGETLEDVKNDTPPVIPSATVKFDPANGVISVPNDLLMSGTKDGTINIPGELSANGASVPRSAYANPSLALGALDGWSSQVPYKVDLTFPANVSLDESSAGAPGAVRIFEVVMGASLTDADCAAVPAGAGCKLLGELTFGVDFITKASGNAVAIIPLKPFKAGSSYINVLTTELKDSLGRSIQPSSTYGLVKQEAPLVTESQLALQGVVNSYENVLISGGTITKDEIIYSAAMTIQSVGPVLGTIKKLLAASLQNPALPKPQVQIPEQDMLTVAEVLLSDPDITNVSPAFNGVQYQRGSVTLAMYLSQPEGKEISKLADTYWQGMCSSPVAVLNQQAADQALREAGKEDEIDPTMFDVGPYEQLCQGLSEGKLHDYPKIDITRHLTKYNPLPKMQSLQEVPVQITKPILPVINAIRTQTGMPALEMPAGGWPVVIMQHGITSKKEHMLALTASLAIQGFATVAIDHPVHGERGIDVDDDGKDDFNATKGEGSVLAYMNLQSLLVARDNLRQSAADLLALRLGLNFVDDTSLNTSDVVFIGHSLGSVVAPAFVAQANAPFDSQVDGLFKINSVALASGGGGIASFLLESASFGPFVQGSVLLSAGTSESAEFQTYREGPAVSNCGEAAPTNESISCGYGEYYTSLNAAGEMTKLAKIQGILSQFSFAAQTALDSGDPTNYASAIKALGTPVYMNVVVGDGEANGNKPDQVIPPMTANNPIAGSLPLANLMGLTTVTQTQTPTEDGMSYLVKFTKGHHSSVLSPDPDAGATAEESAATTTEMQLQIATYLVTRGRALSIQNTEIVTD